MTLHRDGAASDDATAEASADDGAIRRPEAGAEGGASGMYDGTVGMKCQTDADCQPDGGPGVNRCSTSLTDPIFPTPVCISTNCDPGTDGLVHFCDGPDTPASPGVCVAVPNGGVCLPLCVFASDGTAPQGCQGKDTCVFYFASQTTTTPVKPIGAGYCFGGCVADKDCPTGSVCQTNAATCVAKLAPPTKTIGQACTNADNGSATMPAACSCLVGRTATQGYCTQACIVGSTTATCPAGYTCDSFLPKELTDTMDASAPGFSVQNTGLAGECIPTCSLEGGACPGMSTCDNTDTAGPDCLLP